jgi:plasmid stabilization system protein ParE
MACRIAWSQQAVDDLRQIVRFIALDDAVAAAHLAQRILSHLERAGEFPFSNRAVPEKADEAIREVILRPYRIIYHVDSQRDAVHILRIWHSARGIPKFE